MPERTRVFLMGGLFGIQQSLQDREVPACVFVVGKVAQGSRPSCDRDASQRTVNRRVSKLISISLILFYILSLAPAFCQAGIKSPGEDPFAPVASSDTNSQGSVMPNTKLLTVQSMTSNSMSGTAVSPPNFAGLRPLESMSPEDMANRINLIVGDLASAAASVIVPLAVFGMLVSCIVLVLGSLTGWDAARRFGLGGLFMACAGLLVYYNYPLIINLVRVLARCWL
jgi:hypothetical protein